MIVTAVKTFIMIAVVVLLAACKTPEPTPVPSPPASVPAPPPPLPVAASQLKRQSVKAFSVPAASVSIADRLGPNYGTVKKIPVGFEGGKKGWAVEVTWPNWPSTNAYSIQVSSNLVNWTQVLVSSPDPGRAVIIYDLEKAEFYRIVRAFVSTPQ